MPILEDLNFDKYKTFQEQNLFFWNDSKNDPYWTFFHKETLRSRNKVFQKFRIYCIFNTSMATTNSPTSIPN